MDELKNKLKKWNSVFCDGMACKTNVKRDILVVFFAALAAGAFLSVNASNPVPQKPKELPVAPENHPEAQGIVAGTETMAPVLAAENSVAPETAVEKPVDSVKEPPQPPASSEPKIAAPKPKPPAARPKPKPRITAPKPVSFKVVGGKLVCAKKNDKPRKSRQNKGKHLDMECCLDPDEYPNPWCTY